MYTLGVDIGSVSVSLVLLSPEQEIVQTVYALHLGGIRETLDDLLEDVDLDLVGAIVSTSTCPPLILRCGGRDGTVVPSVPSQIAAIRAAKQLYRTGEISGLLIGGGERFGLLQFDDEGNYRHQRANSSCAAGTGSFLDQQAERLGLPDSAGLSRLALQNQGEIPPIASRCSVFAKTDLSHAQQEGYSLEAICDGLCLGLARNIADNLFVKREKIGSGGIIFAGGVSLNQAVTRHLESLIGRKLLVDR